jgi:hypothetical protein
VVRKVLRSGATAFAYERSVQPLPRIGPWRDELDRLLSANEALPARQRLTLMRVFEDLRDVGYEGGYDAVRRYARGWQRARSASLADAYVPLSFALGEAYQFDWSHENSTQPYSPQKRNRPVPAISSFGHWPQRTAATTWLRLSPASR